MKIRVLAIACMMLALPILGYAAEQVDPASVKPDPSKVSLSASEGMPAADAFESLAKQSGMKILLESNVKGKVTVSLKDVTLDAALNAACKGTNMVWRKVYIDPKSELLDKPDRFAATLRLMAGLSFPDLVVAGSSNNKIGVICQQKQGVEDAQDKIVKDLGLAPVYIVCNDALVAAKEAEKNSAVAKYSGMAKDQIDMFMKMTPEEREQALADSLNLMDSIGPEYMSSVMQTLLTTNPDNLQRLVRRQTDMLFSMSPEQRRSMMKLNIEAMKSITPEQQKMIQEDAKAIMEEMKNQQGGQ
jgi:hypothetical protein